MRGYRLLTREEARERFEKLKKALGRLPTTDEVRMKEPKAEQTEIQWPGEPMPNQSAPIPELG